MGALTGPRPPLRRRRLGEAMFVAIPTIVVFAIVLPVGWLPAGIVGGLVAFVLYAFANAPSPHRRHSWGQIWEGIGHTSGSRVKSIRRTLSVTGHNTGKSVATSHALVAVGRSTSGAAVWMKLANACSQRPALRAAAEAPDR